MESQMEKKNHLGALGALGLSLVSVVAGCGGGTSEVTVIAAGSYHTCAVVGGGVRCWGANFSGQLGNNSTTQSAVPVQVEGLTAGVTALDADWQDSCAVVNGEAQCWGAYYGNLSYVPAHVEGLTMGVTAVAAGESHTCVLVNGGVQCWGNNQMGQLGNNSINPGSKVPVQVDGLTTGVTAIAAGRSHTCAVVNGGVQCWGGNSDGQLGNTSIAQDMYSGSKVPVQVEGLTSGVTAIAASLWNTCAVVDGGVQCWGANYYGQLGNNSTTKSAVPVQAEGLTTGATAIAVGATHSCAVVDNAVQCWGENPDGELGNDSTTDSTVPVQVLLQ